MLDRGAIPGVGIIASIELNACPEQPRSDGGKKLLGQGRLAMASYQPSTGPRSLVVCVYLPTGTDGKAERESFQRALVSELHEWTLWPTCVLGDFNMTLDSSTLLGHLEPAGWYRPIMVDIHGKEGIPTYRSGSHESIIDDILISPQALGFCDLALVTYVDEMQHATLTIQSHATSEPYHPVMHPPPIHSTPDAGRGHSGKLGSSCARDA